jgi:hypothetical protein
MVGSNEIPGQAISDVEAVSLADDRLEYVERLGVKDYVHTSSLSPIDRSLPGRKRILDRSSPFDSLIRTEPNPKGTDRG